MNPGQTIRWSKRGVEPSLDELLSDEIAIALMCADRIAPKDVWTMALTAKRRLEAKRNRATPLGVNAGSHLASISALAV